MKKIILVLLFACASAAFTFCNAQYTSILSFSGINGAAPVGSLTPSSSGTMLYGMTSDGGQYSKGTIFSIDTSGAGLTVLFSFHGTNGEYPNGSLTLSSSGNILYGMTTGLSGYSYGTVFSIHTNGTGFKTLFNFDSADGAFPSGSLILAGNKLYGMTFEGGVAGDGNVFSVDTDGTNFRDLLDFNGANGGFPFGSLMLSATGKKLFGMTYGGGAFGGGLIFSIDTSGAGYKALLNFNGTNGESPYYSFLTLSASGKVLYGMTQDGGLDVKGNVFSIDTGGLGYKDLLDFNLPNNGEYPLGSVILVDSTLYGMTLKGGAGNGSIFSVDTNGTGFQNMFNFNYNDGGSPNGSLTYVNGALYGMARQGGAAGDGVIFKYRPGSDSITSVHNIASLQGGVKAYPNPGNGAFNIVIASEVRQSYSIIEVYNTLGEKVYSNTIVHSSSFIVNLNQPAGVYFYRLSDESGNLIGQGKLVIEK